MDTVENRVVITSLLWYSKAFTPRGADAYGKPGLAYLKTGTRKRGRRENTFLLSQFVNVEKVHIISTTIVTVVGFKKKSIKKL